MNFISFSAQGWLPFRVAEPYPSAGCNPGLLLASLRALALSNSIYFCLFGFEKSLMFSSFVLEK